MFTTPPDGLVFQHQAGFLAAAYFFALLLNIALRGQGALRGTRTLFQKFAQERPQKMKHQGLPNIALRGGRGGKSPFSLFPNFSFFHFIRLSWIGRRFFWLLLHFLPSPSNDMCGRDHVNPCDFMTRIFPLPSSLESLLPQGGYLFFKGEVVLPDY